ncbi:zygote arrest protein 1 [Elysia marginata]|uniref:Zygote arrest protein 1 n=1 Tax=Elysia marginata TaxID=1093978 RepID=A0AAV4HUU4_9GAST|nr:zygote arrest protein 1 [Elysia marginata]
MAPYLKRSYGFFRCPSCNKQWESSHVYGTFVDGKFQAKYGQECKDCKIMVKPYRTERLVCKTCGAESCTCTRSDGEDRRHVDESKPHRSDLCGKCRAGLPCRSGRF